MSETTRIDSEKVLVLAPTANDSLVAVEVLRAESFDAVACFSIADLCEQIEKGCGAVVLSQEAISVGTTAALKATFRHQEPWSDLPVVLLTGVGAARMSDVFSSSGNISVLERPFARADLISAVEVAIRARRKQYFAKQLMEEQTAAATKRDEFLATLSHELRTPLNVILGWTEILMSGDLSGADRIEALKILDRNAKVQKSLIDDLLDTSRIITGKLYFDLKPVSLTRILESIHKQYLPSTTEKAIRFTIEKQAADLYVFADEARLSQVFTNLVTNAIKFTPTGGWIEISLKIQGENYEITIADSGQGIDPDFLPFVFERLKQEDMSTTRSHGGLGLGLSITSHIVEQHHGSISATSAGRDKGSKFVVRLPIFEYSKQEKETPKIVRATSNHLDGSKILIVDDSADIRQLIELWLRKANAEVRTVSSASEALRELETFKPDILLSDIGMPGMDGYELIKQIRSSQNLAIRNLPAAALTAYAKDEERTRAILSGFQAHISKPISNDHLISAVSALLSSRSPRDPIHVH